MEALPGPESDPLLRPGLRPDPPPRNPRSGASEVTLVLIVSFDSWYWESEVGLRFRVTRSGPCRGLGASDLRVPGLRAGYTFCCKAEVRHLDEPWSEAYPADLDNILHVLVKANE